MGAFFGFVQVKERPAGDHDLAVFQVELQGALQGEHTRFLVDQCQQLYSKGGLQGCVFVELVENLLRLGSALQFNHDAHTIPVRLITHVGDRVDLAFPVQFGNAFDQAGFIQLVRNFINNDGITTFTNFIDGGFTAHHQVTTTGAVCLANAFPTDNNATGGEIRTRNELHQLFDTHFFDVVETIDQHIQGVH